MKEVENTGKYTIVDLLIVFLIINIMFSGINYLSMYSYVQFILISILLFFKMYRVELNLNYIFVFLLLIAFYTLLSTVWSISKSDHIVYGLKLVSSIFLLFNMVKYNNWVPLFLKCVKVLSIFFALYTILVYIVGKPLYEIVSFLYPYTTYSNMLIALDNGAISGLPGEVSLNAFVILLGFIIILWELIFSEKRHKLAQGLLLVVGFIAILLTKKRSIVLIVIALSILAVLYYILINFKFEEIIKRKKRIIWTVSAVCVLVACVIVIRQLYPNVFAVFDRFKQDNLLVGREELYKYAIEIFKSKPLVGYGYKSYGLIVIEKNATLSSALSGSHNIYLQLLAESGLIGFVLMVSFFVFNIIYTIKKIIKEPRNKYLLIAIFVQISFIVYGLSGNSLFVNSQLVAYFVFCGIIYYNENKEVQNVD